MQSGTIIKVAGIDPSLNNTGLARGFFDTKTGVLDIDHISLIETESLSGKTVRKNSDDMRRAAEIVSGIHEFIADCHIVFAEIPTGSQSARGSFSNGICLGVLGSIGNVGTSFAGRLVQVTPTEVKLKSVGSKTAGKAEMIEWAHGLYPDLSWYWYAKKLQKKNEHMADAIAAINAGIKTDEFRNLSHAISVLTAQNDVCQD